MCVSTASTTPQANSVRYARRDSTGNLARVLSHPMCAQLVNVRGLGFSLESWIVLRLVHDSGLDLATSLLRHKAL